MKIAKKEIGLAIVLTVFVATLGWYTNSLQIDGRFSSRGMLESATLNGVKENYYGDQVGQRVKQITETIEGELEKGTFESVIAQLEILTEEKGGYVYSLYMTYRDEVWNGEMVSKMPTEKVSSFTFRTRAIIEANGTVTYITISVKSVPEDVEGVEELYSTVRISLKETGSVGGEPPAPIVQILSVVPWLVTSLVWIGEGLIIGVPLCFASLSVVLLVKHGILPVWRKQLRKAE
ncbi:MAG: hypothetical protein U9O89_08280 [Thermoproteota archaeon]|nr:hypothetical protein [Thermoproteota archaeon]